MRQVLWNTLEQQLRSLAVEGLVMHVLQDEEIQNQRFHISDLLWCQAEEIQEDLVFMTPNRRWKLNLLIFK